MIEFIKEYWSEILSVIGAAAWMPIIFSPIINFFRKVQVTVLDSRILSNGYMTSAIDREKKTGTIILMTLNFFIKKITLFAKKIDVSVKLNNGASLKTEILDFANITSENTDRGTYSDFFVPINQEFNISRTIKPNVDNIKYLAILVESASFLKIDEVSEIEIRLFYSEKKCKFFSKKVVLKFEDFPRFNASRLIDEVERVRK